MPPRRRRPRCSDGDGWVINGTKNWITNGPVADVCVLFTMNDKAARPQGHHRVHPADEDQGRALRSARRQARHPRQRSRRRSILDDVRLPARRTCSARSAAGFKVAMSTLDGGRIGIAAQALGIARAALEDALAYAQQRRTFGKPIVAAPGDRVQARRHGDRDRCGAPAHAARGVAQGQQAAVRQGSRDGEALRVGCREPRGARGDPDLRRQRLRHRVPRRAPLPRREDHRDLRRHERDPAARDRGYLAKGG